MIGLVICLLFLGSSYIKLKNKELTNNKIIEYNSIILGFEDIEITLNKFIQTCVDRYYINHEREFKNIDNDKVLAELMTKIIKEVVGTMSIDFLNQLLIIYNKNKLNEIIFILSVVAVRDVYSRNVDIEDDENEEDFDMMAKINELNNN